MGCVEKSPLRPGWLRPERAFFAQEYARFKRSVGLAPGVRLYVFGSNSSGGSREALRQALEQRGFIENVWDPTGPWFDLKFCAHGEINFNALAEFQRVNSFERTSELTTKCGLSSNLQHSNTRIDFNPEAFMPRTFHLNSTEEVEHFANEFKVSKAFCILRAWEAHIADKGLPEDTFPETLVQIALKLCQRRLLDIDSLLRDDSTSGEQGSFGVRDEEWQVLQEVDLRKPSAGNIALERHNELFTALSRAGREAHQLRRLDERQCISQATAGFKAGIPGCCERQVLLRNKVVKRAASCRARKANAASTSKLHLTQMLPSSFVTPSSLPQAVSQVTSRSLLASVQQTLEEAKRADVQYAINGKNVWIMKPSGKSRGRGIFLDDDLGHICWSGQRTNGDAFAASYVCQKYIENPLLIGGARKHDIRQWVVVSSVNPLTIWFFSECYVRLAANEYSLGDLKDRFAHLNNNAISCQHERYDPADDYWRCQWAQATYQKLLQEEFGSDVWTDRLLPAMKRIVLASISSVQEALAEPGTSSCSFQLLGYDFLVDTDLNVWLLEVNGSPLMQPSCPITERLCGACLQDLVRVVVDGESNAADEAIDCPHFELLHRGAYVSEALQDSLGELVVEGRGLMHPGPSFTSQVSAKDLAVQSSGTDRSVRREQRRRPALPAQGPSTLCCLEEESYRSMLATLKGSYSPTLSTSDCRTADVRSRLRLCRSSSAVDGKMPF
eukprot:TRINITY_DN109867_c0_g1_i1.p1 TRINITY_DN109867_c0_g1~~TRINITY_DN109867_c0_g1_i1.p1  ORF type:complete len:727 (+),score=127.89 TRINITY_DN109867_c0_g1_i1:56-2236(+)